MSSPDDQLMALLRQQASADYIGEPVSQLDHALQSAMLAEADGADEVVVLAALLHDIGHICDPRAEQMGEVGVRNHEYIGADFLRSMGLFESIASLVENHVNAKRYLVSKHETYAAKLSAASRETLEHQGGAMTPEEAIRFEAHPRVRDILKLRAWDEAAKRPEATTAPLDHYASMLRRNRRAPMTREQMRAWHEDGYLHIRDWFNPTEVDAIRHAADEVGAWPDTPGKWMKYYETSGGERKLCRIENFIDYHPVMRSLAAGEATLNLVGQLFGDPACLFKEKINFKLPGGSGFVAHQDAPAFTSFSQSIHITMMVSIDATTTENGCLEVVRGAHRSGLLAVEPDLTIDRDVRSTLEWEAVPTAPGDLLLFDSFLPHRSGPNESIGPRRALYATYNKAAEGDVREEYFRLKRESFPPDVERRPGRRYDGGVFNVGNPVE